jgi:hypothetical protein
VHVRGKLWSLLINVVILSNLEVKDKGRCSYGRNFDVNSKKKVTNNIRVNYKTRGLGSVIYFTYFSCLGLINLHCGLGLPVSVVVSFRLMKIRCIPMDDFCGSLSLVLLKYLASISTDCCILIR